MGPRFIGPERLGILPDWRGNLFDVFGYHEPVTENEYGKAFSMGPPCIDVDTYPTIEALKTYPWPQVDWFDFSAIRPQIEEWADEFAIAATGASVFQHPTFFRGMEQLLIEMITATPRSPSSCSTR